MRIVIVDNINEQSSELKDELLTHIDEVVEVTIIDNETEALNLVRLDYELFIVNTIIEGIDNEFINYCSRKSKKVIIYTEDKSEERVDEASTLRLIDYVIKSQTNNSKIVVEIIKKYLRNSDLKILFYSNDDKSKIEIIHHIETQNIDIMEARNYDDVKKLLAIEEVEVLLIDYETLDEKGVEFIKEIRKKYSLNELPIILFSYFLRNYIIARFLHSGVNDIIYKPYLKEELINIINIAIDKKELLKENYEWFLMDAITGLYKYKAVESFGQKMLSLAKRDNNPFSVVAIKVMFEFEQRSKSKKNQVLKHFASILGSSLRKGDLISRFSDDKVLILLPNTPISGAETVINKLKEHIKSYPCLDEKSQMVPYFIEGACEDNKDNDLNMMIDIADDLLYRAVKFGNIK